MIVQRANGESCTRSVLPLLQPLSHGSIRWGGLQLTQTGCVYVSMVLYLLLPGPVRTLCSVWILGVGWGLCLRGEGVTGRVKAKIWVQAEH